MYSNHIEIIKESQVLYPQDIKKQSFFIAHRISTQWMSRYCFAENLYAKGEISSVSEEKELQTKRIAGFIEYAANNKELLATDVYYLFASMLRLYDLRHMVQDKEIKKNLNKFFEILKEKIIIDDNQEDIKEDLRYIQSVYTDYFGKEL